MNSQFIEPKNNAYLSFVENKANLSSSKKIYGTERKTDNISTHKSSLKNSCSVGSKSPTHISFTYQSNENNHRPS